MSTAAMPEEAFKVQAVLAGFSRSDLASHFLAEFNRSFRPRSVRVVKTFRQLREQCISTRPIAIVLEDSLLEAGALTESVSRLSDTAPVILLASPDRQADISRLVAKGDVDFVARTGNYLPLMVSLLERRLRWVERATPANELQAAALNGKNIAEIFRHEINNPLTGILGNAEMLLAHREHLSAGNVQRVQTVVDLAVRLRETVRRLSDSLEARPRFLRPA